MEYFHVDVFSDHVLAGNGLTIVFPDKPMSNDLMLKIAQELKQFETAFVFPTIHNQYPVKIFTVQEELDFAGHPIIGTAGLLHNITAPDAVNKAIEIKLGQKDFILKSECHGTYYDVTMNQGVAETISVPDGNFIKEMYAWFNLKQGEIANEYPVSVVSTGLPYLLVPVNRCIGKIKICINNLEDKISRVGAKFVYFFDPKTLECRTWDNTGMYEDIATGSAAGPLLSYLVGKGYKKKNEPVTISQGKYMNRESKITGYVNDDNEVIIKGCVSIFAKGEIFI